VREIEDALLAGDIDVAVHSSKDMPAVLPAGLAIAAVLPREDPLDAIVLPVRARGSGPGPITPDAVGQPSAVHSVEDLIARLGQAPNFGTGSVRRVSQLRRLFPAARFDPIRGNLDTRLRKLDAGAHDALVLAAAGLRRLGLSSRVSFTLPAQACVPAPGQGIVAIEIRESDDRTRRTVAPADDPAARAALTAERAVVAALGGGCQTPIGALALPVDGGAIDLVAVVVALDGSRAVRAAARGSWADAEALGHEAAARLLADGAGDILAEASRHDSPAATHPS
jgi:hydroxymethylbilane synthase